MKKLTPFLIIIATTLIIFSRFLLGYVGITPFVGTNDYTDLQVPFRSVLQNSIKSNQLPLWEPRISAGFPLLAEGQTGIFHPLNILAALLPVPAYISVSINILTTIIISGIGMYLFSLNWLQKKGESRENKAYALFTAFTWCYSGFHLNHFAHLNNINVLSMLPWQLLIIDKIIAKKFRLLYIPLYATTVALQIFSGHPQFTAYALMFNALYFLITNVLDRPNFKKFILSSVLISLGLILGIVIGAVQLLPTLEFTQNSTRQSGISEESSNFLSLRISDLSTFIAPFSNFTQEPRSIGRLANIGWPFDERYSYIGILPLFLAIFALPFILKDKRIIIFSFLGLFFLLLSLGNQSPTGILLRIPPLNMFRLPAKFTVFFQFSMAILATYALTIILNKYIKTKPFEQNNKKIVVITLIIIITILDTAPKVYTLYPLVKGEDWYQTPQTVLSYRQDLQKTQNPNDFAPILGQDYNIQLQKQYLFQDPSLWADHQTEVFKNNREILPAFNMLYYNVPLLSNAINSAGLKVGYYSEIENELFFASPKVKSQTQTQTSYSKPYWSLARLAGAKYIIHDQTLVDDNAELIGKSSFSTGQDQIGLYKVKDPLPFIQIPTNVQIVEDNQTFDAISSDKFNPQTDLILSDKQIDKNTNIQAPQINSDNQATTYTKTAQQIEINLKSESPEYLLIRQTFYPGWQASIDDQNTEILRANHAFQAIYIKNPGAHKIKLQYIPKSFQNGLLISEIGLSIYIALLVTTIFIGYKTKKSTNISTR